VREPARRSRAPSASTSIAGAQGCNRHSSSLLVLASSRRPPRPAVFLDTISRQCPWGTAPGIDVNLFLGLRRPHGGRCTTRRRDGASEVGPGSRVSGDRGMDGSVPRGAAAPGARLPHAQGVPGAFSRLNCPETGGTPHFRPCGGVGIRDGNRIGNHSIRIGCDCHCSPRADGRSTEIATC